MFIGGQLLSRDGNGAGSYNSRLNSIRLAYLVSQYPTVTHTFILREIRSLRGRGFEVHVISIRPPDRPLNQLSEIEQAEARTTFSVKQAGVGAILGAHLATFFGRPLAYLAGLWFAFRLAGPDLRRMTSHVFYFAEAVVAGRHMRRRNLAHVHTHFSSTVALLLARVFPVTFSATIHGPDEFTDPVGFSLREKVAAAKFICAISDYSAGQLMRVSDPEYWHKLDVCRLGVDTNVFLPRAHRENPEQIALLSVGRLAPVKGYPLLISAVDRLVRQGRGNVHLRIAGEGALRPTLERMIAELGLQGHVTLEGSCNQERLRALYGQTDLFVLASFAEGIPVVLMEAMAMEIPCIGTWVNGVPELIRHGVDGWLVPSGSEGELAAAIAMLIDDAELRRRLGHAARTRVQEQYELAHNVETLAQIYERRLAN